MSAVSVTIDRRCSVAALLLMVPVLFSMADAGGWMSQGISSLLQGGGAASGSGLFRAGLLCDILGAGCAVAAFALLLGRAADRVVRIALGVLVVAELYMFVYYIVLFCFPEGRAALPDAVGSVLLLVSIIACCYAWSLLLARPRLRSEERGWCVFLFMPYIMSFVAFYAPVWQQHIPAVEGNVRYLLDYSLLYTLFAYAWNVLRCVALWRFCQSSLFAVGCDAAPVRDGELSPINRYMLAIVISSFLAVQGLALVYSNFSLLKTL